MPVTCELKDRLEDIEPDVTKQIILLQAPMINLKFNKYMQILH